MTARVRDRVKETTTTTGTGDITLLGAVAQFVGLNAAFGLNRWIDYAIVGQTGTEWETGRGYLSGASTLVRARPNDGSAGVGVLVNFSAGTKDVFNTLIARSVTTKGQIQATSLGAGLQ